MLPGGYGVPRGKDVDSWIFGRKSQMKLHFWFVIYWKRKSTLRDTILMVTLAAALLHEEKAPGAAANEMPALPCFC